MDLATLTQLARAVPREEFLSQVADVLLAVATVPGGVTMGFRTAIARASTPPPPRGTLSAVYEVAKAKGNPYPERISIGRAPNCDIVLRVPSVSKLHAHFLVRADPRHPRVYDLVDLGSHNGTRVNGALLTPQVAMAVGVGDLLQLGEISGELIDKETLFSFIR